MESQQWPAVLVATRHGCLWENGNTIRALRGSYTGGFVSFIHAHYAFIKPDPDSCSDMYDGPPTLISATSKTLIQHKTRSKTTTTAKVVNIIGRTPVPTNGRTTGSTTTSAPMEKPISARTLASSRYRIGVTLGACLRDEWVRLK